MAHVVLPACSYMEKTAPLPIPKAMSRPFDGRSIRSDSRPDWEILSAVSVLMGFRSNMATRGRSSKEIEA